MYSYYDVPQAVDELLKVIIDVNVMLQYVNNT